MKKSWSKIIGGIFLIIGIVMLFSSFPNITGFTISENISVLWSRIIGAMFIAVGLVVMSVEEINAAIMSSKGLEEKLGYGKDVELHTIFIRHGEKEETGGFVGAQLTKTGKRQAHDYGKSLAVKDVIKGYSSSIQRSLDTTNEIIKAAPHNKKLKTRIRKEIDMPNMSKEFEIEYEKQVKAGGEDAAADWYLGQGNKRFDKETASSKEVAEGFAYMLQKGIKMSGKLYSGSKVDLIEGTHQILPESLLKEIMIRKINGKEVRGFNSVEEIGGALRYTEPVDFRIKRDKNGKSYIKLDFRGKEYDVDINRLDTLASSYIKKVRKLRK